MKSKLLVGGLVAVVIGIGTGATWINYKINEHAATGRWVNQSGKLVQILPGNPIEIYQAGANEDVQTISEQKRVDGVIKLGGCTGYANLRQCSYACNVINNGKTLRLTSEHGDVLVFERVGN